MNELVSLQELFRNKLFRIPDYQRGYSWTSQQIVEFWEDIMLLSDNRDHYTGMISLRKIELNTIDTMNDEKWLIDKWGYNAYNIVDGQQRLTTFIILINEIVNLFILQNKDKPTNQIYINSIPVTKIIEDYLVIVKPDSDNQIRTYKFGYEIDNPSYEFFKYKILDEENPGEIHETYYTLNLENTKMMFNQLLHETLEKEGIAKIENTFNKLTQKLKFNLHYINDDFNVFIAFETMNNRGKKLSNLELLKNRLIYLTTLFENKEQDVKNKERSKINDTWKSVYGFLGKNKEKALNDDEFLNAHWIIYFKYSRSGSEAYSKFLLNEYFSPKRILKISKDVNITSDENTENEDFDQNEEDLEVVKDTNRKNDKLSIQDIGDYIDSVKNIIPYWYYLNFPNQSNLSEEEKIWLEKINRLGFIYFKPLTVVVLSKKDIPTEVKVEYLKKVERYIFIYFKLSNYMTTYKNNQFYAMASDLYKGNIDIYKVLEAVGDISTWILNEDKTLILNSVISKFERFFKNYKGFYEWNAIRYFLYEYETYIMDNQANQKIYPYDFFKKDKKDKVSIEHIYPQTDTNEYWQSKFSNFTEQQKKILNGNLGNLLPLSLSINSSLQNNSFEDKKNRKPRGYFNGSHSEIEVSNNKDWTEKEILERGLKMLSFMEYRWDFKFANEGDKIKFLALDFLNNQKKV